MTFETCQSLLVTLRKAQGTRHPSIRVHYGGSIIRGRVARSHCDTDQRRDTGSPYGVLVLEDLGLGHGHETLLQIANIPEDGIQPLD
jgi:hypothetical protein